MPSKTINQIPPYVREPEYLLKHRKRLRQRAQERIEKAAKQRVKSIKQRQEIYKRAEKYYQEYQKDKNQIEKQERLAKQEGNFYVKPEAKLALVIRTRGTGNIPPNPRRALQILRLRKKNSCVFVRINKATLGVLKMVEPYIAWGYPTVDTVRELIYKRGYLKDSNGNKTAIASNQQIEELLGKYNIICMEDIVHEIYTVGPHFKEVSNKLWPFALKQTSLGSMKKHFIEGGDFGNREHFINDLVRRMN